VGRGVPVAKCYFNVKQLVYGYSDARSDNEILIKIVCKAAFSDNDRILSVMVLMSYLLAQCSRHRDQQLRRPCCRLLRTWESDGQLQQLSFLLINYMHWRWSRLT